MLIDITLKITPQMVTNAQENERKAFVGHLGTHFDMIIRNFLWNILKERGLFSI